MPEYRKGAHSVYDIQYHFVWVTKYRYPVLKGEVALRGRELIRQSCMSRDIKILEGHLSVDHVHILVSSPPSLSPAKLMPYVKGRTSRMLQDEFSHLKKRYWGQHLWARGYYCATVGTVTEEQYGRISSVMSKNLFRTTSRSTREFQLHLQVAYSHRTLSRL